jgi:hypothetical protein
VLQLGAYVFSAAVMFSTWAWIDTSYGWDTLPSPGASTGTLLIFWLWLFYALFNLWYPVFGVFLIIVMDQTLSAVASDAQDVYVSPLAATFVGCISHMFFQFAAGIILDTIDVFFVCYAIDKDNGVQELKNEEFAKLLLELPMTIKTPLLAPEGLQGGSYVTSGLLDMRQQSDKGGYVQPPFHSQGDGLPAYGEQQHQGGYPAYAQPQGGYAGASYGV